MFFELIRIIVWLVGLSILVPLVFASFTAIGFLFFTPVIHNQSISAWVPQYMYGVMAAVSIALLLLAIGSLGSLFKQKWISKSLALFAVVVCAIGGVVVLGTAYKTFILGVNNVRTVHQEVTLPGSSFSGDIISVQVGVSGLAEYPLHIPMNVTRVHFQPTQGEDILAEVETTLRSPSKELLDNTVSKFIPFNIVSENNSVYINQELPAFSKVVPFAMVDTHITVYIPQDKEVNLKLGDRSISYAASMYVRDTIDKRYRTGRCQDYVFVYDGDKDEFVCKNIARSDDVWFQAIGDNSRGED